jgi:aryl-alcohol dehydrogenase-like predicted oxidoreductase
MRHRNLGRNGPPISVVGFGTWAAGGDMWGRIQDDEVVAAMRRALELGVTWYDTADAYGDGHAEELVAEAFAGRRDEVFIATKCGFRPEGGFSLAPDYIRIACERSLKRLGTDRIDLYQFHWPADRTTHLQDSWATMAALQDEGKVRFTGVSNFKVKHLEICEPIRHVDSLQPEYSMLIRTPEEVLVGWCREHGTGIVTYGSLAYGILTGKFTADATFEREDWRSGGMGITYYDRLFAPKVFKGHLARVERLKEVAAGLAISVAQLAIAWLLRDDAITSAIVGAKRTSQIEETAGTGDAALDAQTLATIEEILSGS